jgi:pilus assembly protein CpaF
MRRLEDLVALGSLTSQAAGFLHVAVRSGHNILVTGPTHSGNTTWNL